MTTQENTPQAVPQGVALLIEVVQQAGAQEQLPDREALRGLFAEKLQVLLTEALAHNDFLADRPEETTRADETAAPQFVDETGPEAPAPQVYETLVTHLNSPTTAQSEPAQETPGENILNAKPVRLTRRELFGGLLGKPVVQAGQEAQSREQSQNNEEGAAAKAVQKAEAARAAGQASVAALVAGFDALLAQALAMENGLAVVVDSNGNELYHCTKEMSSTYAAILAGKSDPAGLLAQTVRENSRQYPRPIPLDMFEYPPFNFTPEVLQACLNQLAESPANADIRFVESSVGTIYLYSETYLERDHAVFLADRADTGLMLNP